MITLCLNSDDIFTAISSVEGSSYLKTVMRLYLDSYKTDYTFNEFYLQYERETITAVIHRYNSYIHVICDDNSDFDELSAFVTGFAESTLISDVLFFNSTQNTNKCYIMSKIGRSASSPCDVKEISDSLKKVCSLVGDSMNDSEKTDFYLNINHQVRHNNLSVFAWFIEDNPVSVAGVTKTFDGLSAITFVYTDKYFRGNGYSKEVLNKVCSDVQTEYHLICEEHNLNFYIKCGFNQVGTCFEIRL